MDAQAQALAKIPSQALAKTPSGVEGLDEITGGGLPQGRCCLVCGGAGSGKTLFGITFLAEGALRYGETGVFICFEETERELSVNAASLGYDLEKLKAENKLAVDRIRVERSEIAETGDYDLEGLFIRIGYAIKTVGAKRVVLDTIETLFSGFSNTAILRAELRRLFAWLKEQGVTSVITGERGEGALTRHGLEEYVSDCVILLDHRVVEQVATRRLRVVKYRGAAHGADEYPFLIDASGISVLPVTSLVLAHEAPNERTPTGVAALDEMLGGKGFWRGSSILVSGAAGTGKSTLAAHFVEAACARGEKAILFAFEESPRQIVRNMASVGIDLQRWIDAGLLRIASTRPTFSGVETHLARMHRDIEDFAPAVVAIDPIYTLGFVGGLAQERIMLLRLVDFLKSRGITAMLTAAEAGVSGEIDQAGVSSLMDAWIQTRVTEQDGERRRSLFILKARGIAHSSAVRGFALTSQGLKLLDARAGAGT
ncbi:circadian clock protein KaiC [Rhodoblastus acidophilus]|uniref:circadian clock protein KaiC n=1 Tax=Rhodoblastus acidophilus TaxID=1074 RepID=UPI002224D5E2|nr:circadian clock protein KaiC [Rhodoblastus acidophilus]MCW2285892.1 circadian clock protein KaiC [Rhodoblastus acidophilus]MCW2334807.1 circadian clock protein KaiC [Rhodoblastus acidophilus]